MTVKKLLREPLVHFLAAGLLLFGLYALVAPAGSSGDTIIINRAMQADMVAQHEKLWNRPPTPAERQALIDGRIAEEILYREGVAMGLDRDDAVIKRRIRQKYELIAEESAGTTPTDADLDAYLRAHRDRFRAPPIIGFTQVMVPVEGSDADVDARIAAMRSALEAGTDPTRIGRPTLLPMVVAAQPLDLVARDFGTRFATALAGVAGPGWQGPLVSSYGVHLVRIDRKTPAADPALMMVRPQVLREWENDRREKARATRLVDVRKRYDVVVEP